MSEKCYENYVGVDVSKKYLDVHIRVGGVYFRLPNTPQGFEEMAKRLKPYGNCLVVSEATGGYEFDLMQSLKSEGFSCAVVNAKFVRRFAESDGQLAKTDRIDAELLSFYAETFKPTAKERVSPEAQALSEIQQRRRQLVDMLTMEKNRYEISHGEARKSVKKTIEFLEKQLKEINEKLSERVKGDEGLQSKVEILKSIKGIGDVIAVSMISDLPELGEVSNKQIAALVGVAPYNKDSGDRRGKRKTAGGRPKVRGALYMGALVAVRHNPVIKIFYDKLCKKGKKKKVALIACLRKLVVIMNTLIRKNVKWENKLVVKQMGIVS